MYGRTARGPLSSLKELWTKENQTEEVRTTNEYVVDLRNRLEETLQLAQEELMKNRSRYKFYADRKRKNKDLRPGMKVLVLLPTDNNKLSMQLKGPYTIKKKVNRFDYKIDVEGKERFYHANLLRKYIERESETGEKGKTGFEESVTRETVKTGFEESDTNEEVEADTDTEGDVEQVCVAVIDEEECDDTSQGAGSSEKEMHQNSHLDSYLRGKTDLSIELPRLESKETFRH